LAPAAACGAGFATWDGTVCSMTVGRFTAGIQGSRIPARRRASTLALAAALPHKAHHNRTLQTEPSNAIGSSASAHAK
jgi:hypothetical protein